jgi:tetratricopeptide (TPR) repeat protein
VQLKLASVRDMVAEEGLASVDEAIGWCDRYRRGFLNEPGVASRAKSSTRKAIARAAKRLLRFPLPEHLRALRDKLVRLKEQPGSEEFEEFLTIVHGLLRSAEPRTSSKIATHAYVLGMILMSMALHHKNRSSWFGGRDKWKAYLQEAEEQFERSIRAADEGLRSADEDDRTALARLRPFLFINWIATVVEQAKRRYRRTLVDAHKLLESRNALDELSDFLDKHPNLWQAAWNGLDLASELFKDDEKALSFYKHLKAIDPGFKSFDYSPGEVQSISKEMPYFSQRFRDKLHEQIATDDEKKSTTRHKRKKKGNGERR